MTVTVLAVALAANLVACAGISAGGAFSPQPPAGMTYSPSRLASAQAGSPIGGVAPDAALSYESTGDQMDLNLASGAEPARINLDRAAILEVLEGRGVATMNKTSTLLSPGTMLMVSAGEGVAVRVDAEPVVLRAHFAPR